MPHLLPQQPPGPASRSPLLRRLASRLPGSPTAGHKGMVETAWTGGAAPGSTWWAFATASQLDGRLFAALARAAEQKLHDFTEEELDNAEWAFARAGEQKVVKRLRQRRKGAPGAGAGAGRSVDASSCG